MLKKRIFIMALVISLFATTSMGAYATTNVADAQSGIPEFGVPKSVQEIRGDDGKTYYLKTFERNGTKTVELISSDPEDNVIVLVNDEETLTINQYVPNCESNDMNPLTMEYDVKSQAYDVRDLDTGKNSDEVFSSLSYSNKVYETYKNRYYYARGHSSYGNDYFKIGCVANYDIKYWTLSDYQKSKCDQYASEIIAANTHMYKAKTAIGADIWGAVLAATLTGLVTFPPAAVVIFVTAGFGAAGSAVWQIIDASENYYHAADLYAVIKGYPHL